MNDGLVSPIVEPDVSFLPYDADEPKSPRVELEIRPELSKHDGRLAVTGIDKRVWAIRHPDRPDELKSAAIPAELRRMFWAV